MGVLDGHAGRDLKVQRMLLPSPADETATNSAPCPKCGGEMISREGHGVRSFECKVCQFVRIVRDEDDGDHGRP